MRIRHSICLQPLVSYYGSSFLLPALDLSALQRSFEGLEDRFADLEKSAETQLKVCILEKEEILKQVGDLNEQIAFERHERAREQRDIQKNLDELQAQLLHANEKNKKLLLELDRASESCELMSLQLDQAKKQIERLYSADVCKSVVLGESIKLNNKIVPMLASLSCND